VAARTSKEADALADLVKSIFEIRRYGELVDFLGIEIQRNRGASTITIAQKAKAEALATVKGVQEAGRAVPRVPMSLECFAGLQAAQTGEPMAHKPGYQKSDRKPVTPGTVHMARHCLAGGGPHCT
jgi:hypothetical protein